MDALITSSRGNGNMFIEPAVGTPDNDPEHVIHTSSMDAQGVWHNTKLFVNRERSIALVQALLPTLSDDQLIELSLDIEAIQTKRGT